MAINKILGTQNPADVLTKYVDCKAMAAAIEKMGMKFYDGRAKSAPEMMGKLDPQ